MRRALAPCQADPRGAAVRSRGLGVGEEAEADGEEKDAASGGAEGAHPRGSFGTGAGVGAGRVAARVGAWRIPP